MNDYQSVRAEIKAWERKFKTEQGRDATVDDIRKQPHIAAKYKTYKKLSKAAAAAASQPAPSQATSSQTQSPTTPTRQSRVRNHDHAGLVALNSRVATAAAPVTSFNPFSPQKAKGKEREKPSARIPQPVFNPFASPSKSRPNASSSRPSISSLLSPPKAPALPAPSTAVTRARKRLRGEPVSPSPSKEKRRKTGSQTTISFPRLSLGSSKPFPGSKDMDHDDSDDDQDDAFVDDSPVKSSSARQFSLLFEDAQPMSSADLFGLKKEAPKRLNQSLFGASDDALKPSGTKALPSLLSQMKQSMPRPGPSSSTTTSTSQTRVASPIEDENETNEGAKIASQDPSRRSRSPLLPPSPPPASASTSRGPGQGGKRKANPKAFANRKKAKLASHGVGSDDDDESGSESSGLKAKVKIVDRPQAKKPTLATEDERDYEFDPLLDLTHRPTIKPPSPRKYDQDTQALDVDLPDKFRDVLDLDTIHWKEHGVEEDKLVDSLIYGRRTTCYDSKKGEIWDVGEDEVGEDLGEREQLDNEWEDEPVPWEVAEL